MNTSIESNVIDGSERISRKIIAILKERALILRAISKDESVSVERRNNANLLLGTHYGYQWFKDLLQTSTYADALKWGNTLKNVRKWGNSVDAFFDNKIEVPINPQEYNRDTVKDSTHLLRT